MAVAPGAAHADTKALTLDGSGRLIGAPPQIDAGDRVRFTVANAPNGRRRLRYQWMADVTTPIDLMAGDDPRFTRVGGSETIVTDEAPRGSRMLMYTLAGDPLRTRTAADPKYKVYRLGGLVVGARRKIVYYRMASDGSPNQPIRLERVADYPVITKDDELYAAVVDKRHDDAMGPFQLTFTTQAGSPPDPAPVRPSADLKILKVGVAPSELDEAYEDVILPFGQLFKGNDVIRVTISTYYDAVTIHKQTTTRVTGAAESTKEEVVTEWTMLRLVDGAEYPQVRALYAYNIATGVVVSRLRDPSFTKYKVQAAAGAAPARYGVERFDGTSAAKPILAFSFYYRPKDIQRAWSYAELFPIPTLGLALTTPADDFFLGGSSELRRSVQLVYGYHWGKITARGPVAADDETSDAGPQTRKEFHGNLFAGLTFNVNFIRPLFGR